MMSDIKMSDTFELPLKGDEFLLAGIEIETDSSMDKLAMTAINAYDENQERIKQLEYALKDLVKISLEMVEKIENEWGVSRGIEALRGKNLIDKEIITAELLLNKEQP